MEKFDNGTSRNKKKFFVLLARNYCILIKMLVYITRKKIILMKDLIIFLLNAMWWIASPILLTLVKIKTNGANAKSQFNAL